MPPAECLRLAGVAVVAATVLLSPVLYTLSVRLADGGSLHAPIYWRSGPKGIDLIALFTPNPGNKLFGAPARAWLTGQNNGYTDNVAALTIVATLLVAFAVWRYRFRPPPLWTAMAVFFGAADARAVHLYRRREHLRRRTVGAAQICAARLGGEDAGPLRHRADDGVRRHLCARASPCPRAVGRSTRSGARRGRRAAGLRAGAAAAPALRGVRARHLSDIASDPRDVRVLDIPLGFVDGEGGEGRNDASSQYYQTFHQKPIIGGRMSRISMRQRERQRMFPVIRLLLRLSEGVEAQRAQKSRAPGTPRRRSSGVRASATSSSTREPPARSSAT